MVKTAKALIEHDGKYLFLLRTDDSVHWPLAWDLPGGKLDPGETAEQALVRELREETGMDAESYDRIADYESMEDELYTFAIFRVVPNSYDVVLSEDHVKFAWLTLEEISERDKMPFMDDLVRKLQTHRS